MIDARERLMYLESIFDTYHVRIVIQIDGFLRSSLVDIIMVSFFFSYPELKDSLSLKGDALGMDS